MRLLLDTCVWFNFVEEEKTLEVLHEVESLLDQEHLELLVPAQIMIELNNNEERILKTLQNRTRTFRNQALKLKPLLTDPSAISLDEIIKEVDDRIPDIDLGYHEAYEAVKRVLAHSRVKHVTVSDNIKIRAAERGLIKRAPFNGSKNSMADAIILESALEFQAANPGDTLYFVTSNPKDFSDSTDKLKPHIDIGDDFAKLDIRYSISPGDAIEEIGQVSVSEAAKKSFHTISDYGSYVQVWDDRLPERCAECEQALVSRGYRVLYGFAGHVALCQMCGKTYHLIDPNY